MIKKFVPLLVLVAGAVMVLASGATDYLSLSYLKENREILDGYVAQKPLLSAAIFMIIYASCVALSLPIATPLTLLGGFLFGAVFGTVYVVTSATVGAAAIFLIAKSSMGEFLRKKAGKIYEKISDEMRENAISYLFFMRLVPLFPFALVNIVPALFNVRLSTFVITTFLGIAPGTFVYVNLGTALGNIENISDLASPKVGIALGLLGLFSLLPIVIKKVKNRRK